MTRNPFPGPARRDAPVPAGRVVGTVRWVIRPLGSRDYRCFLDDPDLLEVPAGFSTPALPELSEPAVLPRVAVPASNDHEPMVPVVHRNIRVLQVYFHAGWEHARPGAFLRSGVAQRLARVAEDLPPGFGLAVLDAWRSLALQAEIYAAAYADPSLPEGFITPPTSDPATPPPHLTGGCVDLTLTWLGRPLALGTGFDDFTDEARTSAFEPVPGRVRQLRRLLYWSMRSAGFVVADCEWWHYELGTGRWSALTGHTPMYGAADIVPGEKTSARRSRYVRHGDV